MATLFLICYAFWLLLKDIFCRKQGKASAPPPPKPKEQKTAICDFSQDEILEFEELIELDKD